MTKMARIEYLLDEAGRKKSLLAGGDGKELQVVEADITPEIINLAKVDGEGNVKLEVGFSTGNSTRRVIVDKKPVKMYDGKGWGWLEEDRVHFFDEPQSVDSLVAWEQARVKRLKAAETDPANLEIIAELEAEHAIREAQKAESEARQAANRAKEAAEREAREAEEKAMKEEREREKRQWIDQHGSNYLKKATKLGYDCQRQYVTERAAREFPGFTVDFNNYADWRSRSCPSEEALELLEDILNRGFKDAKIVWLTAPPYYWSRYSDGHYEAREAVVVGDYLGRYTLIKELETEDCE